MPGLTDGRVLHIEQRHGLTEGIASQTAGFRRRQDFAEDKVSQNAGSQT